MPAARSRRIPAYRRFRGPGRWDEARLYGIISSCGGIPAILPKRPGPPDEASKYLLWELRIARALDLPQLVVAAPGATIPEELRDMAVQLRLDATGQEPYPAAGLDTAIQELWEDWREPRARNFSFLATGRRL